MNPQLQRLEVEAADIGDDEFAVEHTSRGKLRADRIEQLREIAIERFRIAALDQDFVAVAKDQRAKAVPLWFED